MTFFVVKKSRGKGKRDRTYSGYYRLNWMPSVKCVALGTTDKMIALHLLSEIVRKAEYVHFGFSPDVKTVKPLSDCLVDFLAVIRSLGRGKQYINRLRLIMDRIFTFCGWRFPADITSSGFERWRSSCSLSLKSVHFYQSAFSEFCSFLVRSDYITSNPLEKVSKVSLSRSERLQRKALSLDQIRRLLSVLPDQRLKLIVLLAVYAGLRRKEISRLLWSDFVFDPVFPVVVIRSSVSKNGKRAVQPLHKCLVQSLLAFRGSSSSDSLAFGRFPPFNRLKKYWLLAGIPDEPAYDFHALRVTFCTLLEINGSPPRVAMEAMRHSVSYLTEQIYTDRSRLAVRSAIDAIPGLL